MYGKVILNVQYDNTIVNSIWHSAPQTPRLSIHETNIRKLTVLGSHRLQFDFAFKIWAQIRIALDETKTPISLDLHNSFSFSRTIDFREPSSGRATMKIWTNIFARQIYPRKQRVLKRNVAAPNNSLRPIRRSLRSEFPCAPIIDRFAGNKLRLACFASPKMICVSLESLRRKWIASCVLRFAENDLRLAIFDSPEIICVSLEFASRLLRVAGNDVRLACFASPEMICVSLESLCKK